VSLKYFVPGKDAAAMVEMAKKAQNPGAHHPLEATDVAAVHAGYASGESRWRRARGVIRIAPCIDRPTSHPARRSAAALAWQFE
jgi:hypothetical protein